MAWGPFSGALLHADEHGRPNPEFEIGDRAVTA